MKQKIVIRVSITSDKCQSKAMGLVASTRGVESVAIQGYGRDELAVVGNEVDAAELTILLRTKMGNAKLLSVEVATTATTDADAATTDDANNNHDTAGDEQCLHSSSPHR